MLPYLFGRNATFVTSSTPLVGSSFRPFNLQPNPNTNTKIWILTLSPQTLNPNSNPNPRYAHTHLIGGWITGDDVLVSVERYCIVEFACRTEICIEKMESASSLRTFSHGDYPVSQISIPSPAQSAFGGTNTYVFTRTNGLLLAWNALSVVAVSWLALNFWKLILFTMAAGVVGFILVTAILSPVLTFAIKFTGFVKNNLRFIVLISWRGVSTRGVELSQKVIRCW